MYTNKNIHILFTFFNIGLLPTPSSPLSTVDQLSQGPTSIAITPDLLNGKNIFMYVYEICKTCIILFLYFFVYIFPRCINIQWVKIKNV